MMVRIRLRTKLVLSLIFTTAMLTLLSLLVVQNYLRDHARTQIREEITAALETFRQYATQRQDMLRQSTVVSADLPNIRAVMTTGDPATIQDTSGDIWRLTDIDLFLLTDETGELMALHSSSGSLDPSTAQTAVSATLSRQLSRDWWYSRGHLYEMFLEPVYRGSRENNALLGILAAGFAIDDQFASTIARVTSSDVVFWYGDTVVGSSLDPVRKADLSSPEGETPGGAATFLDVSLRNENFVGASADLVSPDGRQPVTVTLLRSYDAATEFLTNINRLLLMVGLVALVSGAGVMYLISRTFTRPLERLASGVAALETGDFSYPLDAAAQGEVGELTAAFVAMRESLETQQKELLHAERLMTIGRMASTVSHDLRHPLTTILAYAELLSEPSLSNQERLEIYRQIRLSVNNMADLIASLLEFSKAQEALQLSYGDCVETLKNTVRTVTLRPEFRDIRLGLTHEGPTEGWFDFQKLDRAFHNLLRNACEAVGPAGSVRVEARGEEFRVDISISDDGPGIPSEIRGDLFQPFVTYGKPDGTGLGLAVVQKVIRDHGGDIGIVSTGPHGTTFRLTLPVTPAPGPKSR